MGPVVSFVLAIVFLGERPSRARSALLSLGFVGVMLVVKPGFSTSPGMLWALGAGTCYGLYLATTRAVAGDYRPRFLLMSQLLIGAVILAPLGLSVEMPEMRVGIASLIVLSALGSAVGNYLLVVANRSAEASLIAPLVYTQLISATVLGVLVFGAWPDAVSLAGLGLIIFSGLATLTLQKKA